MEGLLSGGVRGWRPGLGSGRPENRGENQGEVQHDLVFQFRFTQEHWQLLLWFHFLSFLKTDF